MEYSNEQAYSETVKAIESFKKYGINDPTQLIERYGEYDLALPVSEEEYCGLCGNAIVKITAFTRDQNELPVKKAYFVSSSRSWVPLSRISVSLDSDKPIDEIITKTKLPGVSNDFFRGVSFWLVSVSLQQDDKGSLAIDFKEGRDGFVFHNNNSSKMRERNMEYLRKQSQGSLRLSENIDVDLLTKFIKREFFNG
ncbi:MAG: hypothetical protein FJZ11_06550 [Candidatus Omnitrophica bacterium]|nr:hypothetical protein [Candidatus Omnitrophota bacterium]